MARPNRRRRAHRPAIAQLDPDLPISVAVTDLDGFGPVNAAHGTETDDAVLGSFEHLKSSYYPRPSLHRLTKLARRTGRPEASLLREALDDYLAAIRTCFSGQVV
jgi:GGDEF domain-containing protein